MKITNLISFIVIMILLCTVFSGCCKSPSLPKTNITSENTSSSDDFSTDVSSKHANDTLNVSDDVPIDKDDAETSDISENQSFINANDVSSSEQTDDSSDDSSLTDEDPPAIDEDHQSAGTTEELSVDDYSIFKQGEKYYIAFDDISIYENRGSSEVASLDFKSIKLLKETVTMGKLANWEKNTIATAFPKNDNGILCCDFNNLYTPVLPFGSNVDMVSWNGESYSFLITVDDYVFGTIHCYSKDRFDSVYQSEYENYFEKDTITVAKEENDGEKTTTYYSTSAAKLKQVRYSSTFEGVKYTIDKTYRLDANGKYSLTNVTMYCDNSFVVDLFGFVEEPGDSWLFEFGLTKFVE